MRWMPSWTAWTRCLYTLTTPERLRLLPEFWCRYRRSLIKSTRHPSQRGRTGGTLCCALANRVTHHQARRRPTAGPTPIRTRRALTGEPLAPQPTATATAQRARPDRRGAHQSDYALFRPPARRGGSTRQAAEADLAGKAAQYRSGRAGPLPLSGSRDHTPRRPPTQRGHHPEQPAIRR